MAVQSEGQGSWTPEGEDEECRRLAEEAQDGGTPCAKRRSPSHDMSWQMGPQETNAEPQGSAEPEKSATDPPATMGGTGMKAMYSGREYGHLAMLRSHLQTHSDQLQCKLCEETFASASELRLHTPRHLGIPPYKCSECDLVFRLVADLRKHALSMHNLLHPFRCRYCDYTSAQVIKMRLHMCSHTGAQPFSCPQCLYVTMDKSAMKMHTEVHIRKLHASLEPVLKCQLCGKIGYRHQILEQNQQRRRDEKQGGDRESGEMSLLDGERDLGPRGEVTPKYRLLSEKVEGGSIISTL
ncbi:transcriptional repressor CTCFL isoform X2 [Dendropsophus ebraccatus]|uniref:transcriptional repressor CTCFL isoform X2 n=1 Tax=Dendropsophus ebraccatus TaxID=150705 RepID=UPI003831F15A